MNNAEFLARYGTVALVTGASSGIGRSFAELLAARGFELVLIARRKPRLEELSARLAHQHGTKCTLLPLDLSAADAPARILAATEKVAVGILISNAGFGMKGELAANDARAMADMLMVNCHVPMQLARGFVPRLRARGRGAIVLTSSVEGLIGCPYSTAYSATKALVKSLGEGLWAELQPEGIDVLTLCPGATDTEAPVLQGIDPATLRNVMSPDEVAALTLDNLKNGPTYIPSAHYRALFEQLVAMPRREALLAMAGNMQKSSKPE
jgi:short-subunit dehydrogenase